MFKAVFKKALGLGLGATVGFAGAGGLMLVLTIGLPSTSMLAVCAGVVGAAVGLVVDSKYEISQGVRVRMLESTHQSTENLLRSGRLDPLTALRDVVNADADYEEGKSFFGVNAGSAEAGRNRDLWLINNVLPSVLAQLPGRRMLELQYLRMVLILVRSVDSTSLLQRAVFGRQSVARCLASVEGIDFEEKYAELVIPTEVLPNALEGRDTTGVDSPLARQEEQRQYPQAERLVALRQVDPDTDIGAIKAASINAVSPSGPTEAEPDHLRSGT